MEALIELVAFELLLRARGLNLIPPVSRTHHKGVSNDMRSLASPSLPFLPLAYSLVCKLGRLSKCVCHCALESHIWIPFRLFHKLRHAEATDIHRSLRIPPDRFADG